MTINRLDHVNVRTSKLVEMVRWYDQVLGLKTGPRPNFPFNGAWIYVNDDPVIHLVEVDTECASVEPKIEHYAFQASGLNDLVTHLQELEIEHSVDPVPGMPITQINLIDVDGNHIHIDFRTETG
jgi:catechol 2,3-dioxygenase-like lactoylglutathione lyase family enzyme